MNFVFHTTVILVSALLIACGNNSEAPAVHEVEIVVEVPEDAPTAYLTGNIGELGPWDPGTMAMTGEGRDRKATVIVLAGHVLEYKIIFGSWEREAVDRFNRTLPNYTHRVSADQTTSH